MIPMQLNITLGVVDLQSAAAFIWTVTKLSYSWLEVCLLDVTWTISSLFLTVTTYWFLILQLVSEGESYRESLTVYLLYLHRLKYIFAETILWLEYAHSNEEYYSQVKALITHFLLININSSYALDLFELVYVNSFPSLFLNLVFRHAELFTSEKSVIYSSVLFSKLCHHI